MPDVFPTAVYGWLREHTGDSISEKIVPGATLDERRSLAALGGIVRKLSAADEGLMPTGIGAWLSEAPTPPAEIVDAVREQVSADADGALARLYADQVKAANRRPLGTFFTPSLETKLMLEMWSESQGDPATVIDIGAGVGVFTAAASSKWPKAQVVAVDVNPVTLGLLAIHPEVSRRLVGQDSNAPGIRLVLDDFTAWIADEAEQGPSPRLFLGNPPYTRAQLLPREDRIRLQEDVNGLCGGRASLSTIITALCFLYLAPTDGLCLLLPAQWLESDYANPLRKALWAARQRRIELRLVDSALFQDAQVDAVALLVGAQSTELQGFYVGGFDGELKAIDRSRPVPESWRQLFASGFGPKRPANKRPQRQLGDVARVRRGLATGANDFFLLSPERLKETNLPEDLMRPMIRRLNQVESELTSEALMTSAEDSRKYVLMATAKDRLENRALDAYLMAGERAGFHLRELCRRRSVWFDLAHDAFVPDVIIGAMTRGRFHVVENRAKAVITNNLYGWIWDECATQDDRDAILKWLRSAAGQKALAAVARTQGDGLLKLEPGALRKLALPVKKAR